MEVFVQLKSSSLWNGTEFDTQKGGGVIIIYNNFAGKL